MPKCVECQVEVPREQMRGAPDDLRCPNCAARYAQIYDKFPQRRPAPPPVVTGALCVIATGVSLAYWAELPQVTWLTAESQAVWEGQLWRLFTTIFPHVNFLHLLFNLYWMWRFGRVLEAWAGPVHYTGLILLLALGSSATSFLCSEHGVGLSGVGFGLFGLLYALRRDKDFAAAEMQSNVVQLWVGWFFFCILLTYTHVMPIGNIAHGSGVVLGWLTGQAIIRRERVRLLAGLSLVVAGLVAATLYMPWDGMYAWHQGQLCAERGDNAGAVYWYEKAARAYPDEGALQDYLRWLRQANERGAPSSSRTGPETDESTAQSVAAPDPTGSGSAGGSSAGR